MEKLYERHQRLAAHTRQGLERLGFKLVAAAGYQSPTVTVAWTPEGVTADYVQRQLVERHGIYIATGQAHMRDNAIRIGHMGWTHQPELDRTLEALDDVLERAPVMAG
jgi:aspartate aminotransferase-like enzyme